MQILDVMHLFSFGETFLVFLFSCHYKFAFVFGFEVTFALKKHSYVFFFKDLMSHIPNIMDDGLIMFTLKAWIETPLSFFGSSFSSWILSRCDGVIETQLSSTRMDVSWVSELVQVINSAGWCCFLGLFFFNWYFFTSKINR